MSDFLACVRVDPPGSVAVGSVRRVCVDCAAAVWVAPSGLAILARGAVAVCLPCARVRIERDPDLQLMAPSAEQLGEVGEWLRRARP